MTRARLILAIRCVTLLALAFLYSAEVFLLVPVALMMPVLSTPAPECGSACIGGTTPAHVTIVVSGSGCAGVDGTYILDFDSDDGTLCRYTYATTIGAASYTIDAQLRSDLSLGGADAVFRMNRGGDANSWASADFAASPVNCSTIGTLTLPASLVGLCTGGSTVTFTPS